MIIDSWFAALGVIAYAVWAAVCVLIGGLSIGAHQQTRQPFWLAVLMASTAMAARFALLSVAIGPIQLLDRRQGQIVAWGLDMLGAVAAVVALMLYLRYLYRVSPPRRQRHVEVENCAAGME